MLISFDFKFNKLFHLYLFVCFFIENLDRRWNNSKSKWANITSWWKMEANLTTWVSFLIVYMFSLGISICHKTCFIFTNWSICPKCDLQDTIVTYGLAITGQINQLSYLVYCHWVQLISHSSYPLSRWWGEPLIKWDCIFDIDEWFQHDFVEHIWRFSFHVTMTTDNQFMFAEK